MDIEPSPPIVELDVLQPDVQHTDEANLMTSLRKKVNSSAILSFLTCFDILKVTDLELELQERDASHAELRIQNQLLESSRRDLEKTIQDMQPKYQEALNDRGRFEHEMKESVTHANALQQRLDLRISELTKLRDEKAASDAELAAARTALTGSAVPEVAELSRVKQEMTTVRGENERLQKRVTSMQSELEYMRTNYQQASSAAAEAVSELNEVKAELSAAQQKASENARLIHESQASSETKQYLIRIKELEAEKSGAEWELEKKSEELRAMLNGRRATRGTSVPRSPRMGTMSPGSRPMARVLSVGSRGNSPAPGDWPPYRGTFTGEALFTTVPGSSRFGNHLM
jgi:chromosome segregation ATPase